MSDELWTEICDTVHETVIKTIPPKKKCKKTKWLSEEALQMAVKRREAKNKGEKERYTHLNEEFQRIARIDKKAFLSDHTIVIIWVMKIFFVQFFCVFLPPLFNIFCFC